MWCRDFRGIAEDEEGVLEEEQIVGRGQLEEFMVVNVMRGQMECSRRARY